jgi:NTE family protein
LALINLYAIIIESIYRGEQKMNNLINGVFDGGGVKGIGLVGAVSTTEEKGYRFNRVAGTSAGAIVAAFLAAGYTSKEMKAIIDDLNYNDFKDKGKEDRIPGVGYILSLWFQNGIYEGYYFEDWIRKKLSKKCIKTFGDLRMPNGEYKLKVTATDISRHKLMLLPDDISDYGIHPDDLDVALAIRMSMSIPLFFEPVALRHKNGSIGHIVDGGVLSNYPIWVFDKDTVPTLGYKLVENREDKTGQASQINNPVNLLSELVVTMLEAHDNRYIEDNDFVRTIPIETLGIKTIDFNITPDESHALYLSGRLAAEKFFDWWNIDGYGNQNFMRRSERIKRNFKKSIRDLHDLKNRL